MTIERRVVGLGDEAKLFGTSRDGGESEVDIVALVWSASTPACDVDMDDGCSKLHLPRSGEQPDPRPGGCQARGLWSGSAASLSNGNAC